MTDAKTETPLVDAQVGAHSTFFDVVFVTADFARTLELRMAENEAGMDSWRQAAFDARQENAALRRALQTSPCPHPCTEDDGTVADCIKNANCGCDNRACLAAISGTEGT